MTSRVLPRRFYRRDPRAVAPELLGKLLCHDGRVGRIVEVEAYRGRDDPASHAFRGPTRRSAIMFGPPGRLYVYRSYGVHWCANAVCGPAGVAGAVLIRALEPVRGVARMRKARGVDGPDHRLCSGPGRLCQALGIAGGHDGVDLVAGPVRIRDDGVAPPAAPHIGRRIGISVGEELAYRFAHPSSPSVSARL